MSNPNRPFIITGLPPELLTPALMDVLQRSFDRHGLAVAADEGDLLVSIEHPPVSAKDLFSLSNEDGRIVRVKQALRSAMCELNLQRENFNG